MKDAPPLDEISFSPIITPIEATDPEFPNLNLYLAKTEIPQSDKKPRLSSKIRTN